MLEGELTQGPIFEEAAEIALAIFGTREPSAGAKQYSLAYWRSLCILYMYMDIEWDRGKAASNFRKHGVTFAEAATCLLDPMALAMEDDNSEGEPRWLLVGLSDQLRLLTLVYTRRGKDTLRLISARKATRGEAENYA